MMVVEISRVSLAHPTQSFVRAGCPNVRFAYAVLGAVLGLGAVCKVGRRMTDICSIGLLIAAVEHGSRTVRQSRL